MKTVVELYPGKTRAVFESNGIDCDKAEVLEEILRVVSKVLDSPSIPDLDYHKAQLACDMMGGKIVQYDGPPTDQDNPEEIH